MSGSTIIELCGVSVVHREAPDVALVRDVTWRIGEREFWVLVGDHASGKTALLSVAAGLLRPAAGALRIFGRDLREASEQEQVDWRRHLGFVFEHNGRLLSHLTVAENVGLPIQYHRNLPAAEARTKADEWLARAALSGVADVLPSRLSPRLQQRVSLLRAFAEPTRVLFLDDPLTGLGPSGARWWLTILEELRAEQAARGEPLAIVATADDFSGWVEVADHFAVIENQQLRVLEQRDQVRAYQQTVLRDFVGKAN